jgi:hypothetical protein
MEPSPLGELIGTDLPAEEVERLARVDAVLREAARPKLRVVSTEAATTGPARRAADEQTYQLTLTFRELAVIYKSLQAAKTLQALPPQDELLEDTLELVHQAINDAGSGSAHAG